MLLSVLNIPKKLNGRDWYSQKKKSENSMDFSKNFWIFKKVGISQPLRTSKETLRGKYYTKKASLGVYGDVVVV